MFRTPMRIALMATLAGVAACSDSGGAQVDQGIDADSQPSKDAVAAADGARDQAVVPDTGVDIGVDAGADAAADTGADAAADTGADAAADTGVDVGADVGPDVGPDLGPDIGVDAGPTIAVDCLAHRLANGGATDGSYWIDPSGTSPLQASCDMTTAGGGWTVYFDVCGDASASREAPLDSALATLAVGQVHVTTVDGSTLLVDRLEPGISTVADFYQGGWFEPSNGVAWRVKRLGDGLDILDDGDCVSASGTVQCTNLFNAFNRAHPTYGNDYGCREGTACQSLFTTHDNYKRAVCKIMVRSNDFSALAPLQSCLAHRQAGRSIDGVYSIDPDGSGTRAPFDVFCDMTTEGGGWTLITSIDEDKTVTPVDDTTLITPASNNVTNRNLQLPGASEVLIVNDGRDDGFESAYDKRELFSGVSGHPLSWQQVIDALNADSGGTWADLSYSTGSDDGWQFTVTRVNTTGCLQTPLRATYGDGNYGGFNGEGYAPPGALYIHWGAEVSIAGIYGNIGPTLSVYRFSDLRCDTQLRIFSRFWHGVFLR